MYPPQSTEDAASPAAHDAESTWPGQDKAVLIASLLPAMARLKSARILELITAGDDGVFIQYEYEHTNGERHRNTEFVAVLNGQPMETQLFFGGRIPKHGSIDPASQPG